LFDHFAEAVGLAGAEIVAGEPGGAGVQAGGEGVDEVVDVNPVAELGAGAEGGGFAVFETAGGVAEDVVGVVTGAVDLKDFGDNNGGGVDGCEGFDPAGGGVFGGDVGVIGEGGTGVDVFFVPGLSV
jgi:hypothetical protein